MTYRATNSLRGTFLPHNWEISTISIITTKSSLISIHLHLSPIPHFPKPLDTILNNLNLMRMMNNPTSTTTSTTTRATTTSTSRQTFRNKVSRKVLKLDRNMQVFLHPVLLPLPSEDQVTILQWLLVEFIDQVGCSVDPGRHG